MKLLTLNIIIFFFLITCNVNAGMQRYDSIIHVHTSYSSGKLSLEELIQKANNKGISIVIPTDTLINKWEYGIFPFRRLFKRTFELPSISYFGIQAYLDEINYCREKFSNMVIIPGVEVTPYYYWKGTPLNNSLMLCGANKDMLIIGLEDKHDYETVPVIGNQKAKTWRWESIIPLFIPVPLKSYAFGQYDGDIYKEKPYQAVIDDVNKKNGLVFWAHPDAKEYVTPKQIGNLAVQSDTYGRAIVDTYGHNGFAFFRQGGLSGRIGGYWDKALMMYCAGLRPAPVWAIAELDQKIHTYNFDIDKVKTVFFLEKLSVNTVMVSLKKGNFYCVLKPDTHELFLEEYYVVNNENKAFSGEILKNSEKPRFFVRVSSSDNKKHGVMLYIICNGKEIIKKEQMVPFEFTFSLQDVLTNSKNYIRIDIIEHESSRIITNPIFID